MSWKDNLPAVRGKLLRDEPLGPFTWFRVGGPAEVLFLPADADDPARWDEFRRRYREELDAMPDATARLRDLAKQGKLTLLYGAHDEAHNNAVVLANYLKA